MRSDILAFSRHSVFTYHFGYFFVLIITAVTAMASKSRRHQTSAGTHILSPKYPFFHKLTVVQLRAKLNEHNILHEKSDKKSQLIEECVKNGLDMNRQPLEHEDAIRDNTL